MSNLAATFMQQSVQQYGVESAGTAIAAQARAMVESRYIMAMKNPRNWDAVRQDLIKECRRPSFAHNTSAYYIKPIGKGVEGLGIRFVEMALRCMKNVLVETTMIFEDDLKEVHRVSVTDLEANITYPIDVRVSKTVERSKPNSDGSYLSVRKNSWNKDTFTVLGNDDELLNKRGALISKAIRTIGLRIIPGDLCDEAEEIIKSIRLDSAAQDPDLSRRKIVDGFAEIRVTVADLSDYLGHDIGKCSPAQIVKLRGIYGAIRDGEATWQTVMANKSEEVRSAPPVVVADKTPVAQATAALPIYTDDQFQKNLGLWQGLIESGKKTAEQIISMVSSKSSLTEDQLYLIRAAVAPEGQPA